MKHDYFQPQPVHNATAFFTRQITHNLTDEDTVRFLRAFVPALEASKPGTPVLINDTVIPEPGEKSAYEEHGLRQVDLAMWIVFNSKQRTVREFEKLLAQADARLRVRVLSQLPKNSSKLTLRIACQGPQQGEYGVARGTVRSPGFGRKRQCSQT